MRRINNQIFNFIKSYYLIHGYAPSFSEVSEKLGIGHRGTVRRAVIELCIAGELQTDHLGEDRAYKLPQEEIEENERPVHTMQKWGL